RRDRRRGRRRLDGECHRPRRKGRGRRSGSRPRRREDREQRSRQYRRKGETNETGEPNYMTDHGLSFTWTGHPQTSVRAQAVGRSRTRSRRTANSALLFSGRPPRRTYTCSKETVKSGFSTVVATVENALGARRDRSGTRASYGVLMVASLQRQ